MPPKNMKTCIAIRDKDITFSYIIIFYVRWKKNVNRNLGKTSALFLCVQKDKYNQHPTNKNNSRRLLCLFFSWYTERDNKKQ